jgi:hypothetical protein
VRRILLILMAASALVACGSFMLIAPPTPPPKIADGMHLGLRFVTPVELGPGMISPEQARAAADAAEPPRVEQQPPFLGVYAAWKEVRGPIIPRPPTAGGDEEAVGVAEIEEVPVWVVVYGWPSGEVFEIALIDARSGQLIVEPPLTQP